MKPPTSLYCPVSLHVKAMQNNVTIDHGLREFRWAVYKHEEQTIPTEFLVRMLGFVPSSNKFMFHKNLFLHVQGKAIGNQRFQTLAYIFVGRNEVIMLLQWQEVGEKRPNL